MLTIRACGFIHAEGDKTRESIPAGNIEYHGDKYANRLEEAISFRSVENQADNGTCGIHESMTIYGTKHLVPVRALL